ncbi:hypothetical protein ACMFMF_009385 [Clarireedia jacksonii]
MATMGKTINDLPAEIIIKILEHIPIIERQIIGTKVKIPVGCKLSYPQISTATLFGLTCHKHWEIFRHMIPKTFFLDLHLSPRWSITYWPQPRASWMFLSRESLVFLLIDWMAPNYRLTHASPLNTHFDNHLHLLSSFVPCKIYGNGSWPLTYMDKERDIRLSAWTRLCISMRSRNNPNEPTLPHPFNKGGKWYFAAGQAIKAKVSSFIQNPIDDPRREECNWTGRGKFARLLLTVEKNIMGAWVKAAASNTPITQIDLGNDWYWRLDADEPDYPFPKARSAEWCGVVIRVASTGTTSVAIEATSVAIEATDN